MSTLCTCWSTIRTASLGKFCTWSIRGTKRSIFLVEYPPSSYHTLIGNYRFTCWHLDQPLLLIRLHDIPVLSGLTWSGIEHRGEAGRYSMARGTDIHVSIHSTYLRACNICRFMSSQQTSSQDDVRCERPTLVSGTYYVFSRNNPFNDHMIFSGRNVFIKPEFIGDT